MYFENILAVIFKRKIHVSDKTMEKLLKGFIKEKLNKQYTKMKIEPKPKIEINIIEDPNRLGYTFGNNHIDINKELIKKLCNGEKSYMNVIFHELYHTKQFCQLEKELWNDITLLYLKDSLLNVFENKVNNNEKSEYVKNNYKVESTEYYAYINGNIETIDFFNKHKIRLTRKELKRLNEEKKELTSIRYVGGNKLFKEEYMDIDEAIDYALLYNKEWLESFPILKKDIKKRKKMK